MFNLSSTKLSAVCVLSIATALLASCSGKGQPQEEAIQEFSVKTLDTGTVTSYAEFSTVIQSQDVIEIRPRITGYIDKIYTKEGAHVKKGEVIFQIADADYKQQVNAAKAGVQSAKAQLDNATLEVQKLTPLVEKGIISPFELKSAASKKDAAQAGLEQANAEYENALINLGYTKIISPVEGLLGIISVRAGSLVSNGASDPLTTVSGSGDISAYFSVDEKLLVYLREIIDRPIASKEGYVDLILANGATYSQKGKLENASGIIDRSTGSIQMKVVFPNPKMEILSGSSGILKFPSKYNGVIAVPQNATYELQDKIMAFIVGDDNVVKGVSLAIAGKTETEYIVTNLKAGDRIVTEGVNKLRDGQNIKPKLN